MDISIGLPNAVPATTGGQLVEWAIHAEARQFRSLGTLDRLLYPNYEPLISLTAAAAVTERIRLMTAVLLGPLRSAPTVFAKEALSLHALSGERLVLGFGLGAREDDFEFSGLAFNKRGAAFDAILQRVVEAWASGQMGPKATTTVPALLFGGGSKAAHTRAARYGVGWIAGASGNAELFAVAAENVKVQFSSEGRDEPVLKALAYFSLGERARANATSYLGDYYSWLGPDKVNSTVETAAMDAEKVRQYVEAFERVGCGELMFLPCSNDPTQVDLLADAVGLTT